MPIKKGNVVRAAQFEKIERATDQAARAPLPATRRSSLTFLRESTISQAANVGASVLEPGQPAAVTGTVFDYYQRGVVLEVTKFDPELHEDEDVVICVDEIRVGTTLEQFVKRVCSLGMCWALYTGSNGRFAHIAADGESIELADSGFIQVLDTKESGFALIRFPVHTVEARDDWQPLTWISQ